MDYEIVDKPMFTSHIQGSTPVWRPLFESLPVNKALMFRFPTKKKANSQRISIAGSLWQTGAEFHTNSRIIPDGDEWILYVWKREENERE